MFDMRRQKQSAGGRSVGGVAPCRGFKFFALLFVFFSPNFPNFNFQPNANHQPFCAAFQPSDWLLASVFKG
jgi:hypothetical protein